MHEILERCIGWYHVWRDRRLQHNPLDAPALIAVIGIVQIAYNLLARHNFSWRAAFLTVINVAFLVLYVRKWRWAWLILPIWGAMFSSRYLRHSISRAVILRA